MPSPRTVVSHALAYAEKDIRGFLRFKVSYVIGLLAPAIANFGLFGTVMFGFFASSSASFSQLNSQNFVAFTFLGALCASLYGMGSSSYSTRFMNEKYWQTAPVILASPLAPIEMLLGVAMSDILSFSIVASLFLILSYITFRVAILTVAYTILLLGAIYFLVAGFSLIRGALLLANENIDPIINYLIIGTGYLSCFYFPLSFVPSIIRPFAMINPLYFLVYSARAIWLGLPLPIYYPIAGVVAVIASLAIGSYLFSKIWRNLDITGY